MSSYCRKTANNLKCNRHGPGRYRSLSSLRCVAFHAARRSQEVPPLAPFPLPPPPHTLISILKRYKCTAALTKRAHRLISSPYYQRSTSTTRLPWAEFLPACCRGHVDSVNEVRWQPFTSSLCTASSDKTVSIWDARSGLCTQTFYGHHNSCNSVTFNLRGTSLASTDADGVV